MWRHVIFLACVLMVAGAYAGAATSEPIVVEEIELVSSPAPGSGSILQTKGLGSGGSVDDFLTDVVPGWPGWNRNFWTDKELWGNQGYIIGGPGRRIDFAGAVEMAVPVGSSELIIANAEPVDVPFEPADLEDRLLQADSHTVVKGECLWIIAGYPEIYNNPLQWPMIYKANRDRIKNPDLIYPGQVFSIPRD